MGACGMSITDVSRMIIGAGYLILALVVIRGLRQWFLKPSQRPLWWSTALVLGWWAHVYLLFLFYNPPRTQTWLLYFHIGHWFFFGLFGAWLRTEYHKRKPHGD